MWRAASCALCAALLIYDTRASDFLPDSDCDDTAGAPGHVSLHLRKRKNKKDCPPSEPPQPSQPATCECDKSDRRRMSRSASQNCFGCEYAFHARRRHWGAELLETCQSTCALEIGCKVDLQKCPPPKPPPVEEEVEEDDDDEDEEDAPKEMKEPDQPEKPKKDCDEPTPPAAPPKMIKTCHPMCFWKCGEKKCPQKCEPKCDPAKCSTRCKGFNTDSCQMECGQPQCRTECPEQFCGKQECPKCKTVCAQPVCKMKCAETDPQPCREVCAQPVCRWECKKLTEEGCAQPKCHMECDTPCNDVTQSLGSLPPLEKGELEVSNFDADPLKESSGKPQLLLLSHGSMIWVNATSRGEDGIVKKSYVQMRVKFNTVNGSMKVAKQGQLRPASQGHLQA